jgi:hypothetical protein
MTCQVTDTLPHIKTTAAYNYSVPMSTVGASYGLGPARDQHLLLSMEWSLRKTIFFPILKVASQCPLVLLIEVNLRKSEALGREKVKF